MCPCDPLLKKVFKLKHTMRSNHSGQWYKLKSSSQSLNPYFSNDPDDSTNDLLLEGMLYALSYRAVLCAIVSRYANINIPTYLNSLIGPPLA